MRLSGLLPTTQEPGQYAAVTIYKAAEAAGYRKVRQCGELFRGKYGKGADEYRRENRPQSQG